MTEKRSQTHDLRVRASLAQAGEAYHFLNQADDEWARGTSESKFLGDRALQQAIAMIEAKEKKG